jgi:type II secretory pathway pseudopilin PulG
MISPARRRCGFTLFQLLVVLAILALLIGLALPAIQKVRQAAARIQCSNNFKQIALATINCADTYEGRLPPLVGYYPKAVEAEKTGLGTLFFHILPYIEQDNLYQASLDKDSKMYSVWNNGTYARLIRTYVCPAEFVNPRGMFEDWLATTNYAANFEVFGNPAAENRLQGAARFPASITDGTSNTVFFTERYQICNGDPTGWGYTGDSVRVPGYGMFGPVYLQVMPAPKECEPGTPQSLHPSGINAGLGDGSVRFVNSKISWETWRAATTPSGGEVLGADW